MVYATELKASLAGVPEELLAERGPVDPDVARGARRGRAGSAAAPTGAWPPPASPARSRRTASRSAWSTSRSPARPAREVRELDLDGGRDDVRAGAVIEALRLLAERLASPRRRPDAWPAGAGEPAGRRRAVGAPPAGRSRRTGFGGAGCRRGPQRVRLREASRRLPVGARGAGGGAMVLLRRVIGDALRARRQGQHRTLREVSTAANVSLGYLSEIERGQKEASSELLAAICDALGARLSEVLREVSDTRRAGRADARACSSLGRRTSRPASRRRAAGPQGRPSRRRRARSPPTATVVRLGPPGLAAQGHPAQHPVRRKRDRDVVCAA